MLEEEPVASKTHDRQLESDPNPVEVCNKSSASLKRTERVSKERIHLGRSPPKGESGDLSHQEGLESRSFHLSPEQSPCHQARRQSWRRASMKETNRRKSLPPFHQGITGGVLCT